MSFRDLSRACWRCAYWGGFAYASASHSICSRLNASPVQASPANGCAFWVAGPGDAHAADWHPIGFRPWDGPRIYGKPAADEASPSLATGQPHLPCDQFAYQQAAEAAAWRVTGELLMRARSGRS